MADNKQSALDRIRKSIFVLIKHFPFLGRLSTFLILKERPDIYTAATDGKHYFYNVPFFDKLSDEEINFITAHEVLHVVFKHMFRSKKLDKLIYNFAADYVINGALKEFDPEGKVFKMIEGGLYNEKYVGLYTEEVYKRITENQDESAKIERYRKQKDSGGGNGNGSDQPIDNHDVWDELVEKMTPAERREFENQWERIINTELGRSRRQGYMPVGVLRRLMEEVAPRKKNWKELLHEFLEHETNDFGYNPPPKDRWHLQEYGIETIPPDWSEQEEVIRNIVFAVDTSGSMTEDLIRMVHMEIVACIQQFRGKVDGKLIYCDAKVYHDGIYELSELDKAIPKGGGGTSFVPVFNWISENMHGQCAGLVYLTDGYGTFPDEKPNYPILWIITKKSHEETVETPFGATAELNLDEE